MAFLKQVFLAGFMLLSVTTATQAVEDLGDLKQRVDLPPCPDCFDVLGIKLRDKCGSLPIPNYNKEEIKGKFQVLDAPQNIKYNEFVTHLRFSQELSEYNDTITLECSSPLTGSVVQAIRRSVDFISVEKAPLLAAVDDDARMKNGVPVLEGDDPRRATKILIFALDNMLERKKEKDSDHAEKYVSQQKKKKKKKKKSAMYRLTKCGADQSRVCEIMIELSDLMGKDEDKKLGEVFYSELWKLDNEIKERQRQENSKNAPAPPKL